jgi:hypothetical protein
MHKASQQRGDELNRVLPPMRAQRHDFCMRVIRNDKD